jgi:hypothetical protein
MTSTIKERLHDLANEAPTSLEVPATLAPRARRRLARNVAVGVGALGVVAALSLAGVHSLTRVSGHRPAASPRDTFAGVHGWIAFSDSGLQAVNPDDPSASMYLPTSVRVTQVPIAWSRDGSKLLVRDHDRLSVLFSDGSEQFVATGLWGSFSPDGTRVVYEDGAGSLFVVDLGGGPPRLLLPGGGMANGDMWFFFPEWSPDGTQIAFLSRSQGRSDWAISSIAPDGSGERVIANLQGLRITEAGGLAWKPDGSQLLFFISPRKYHAQIWVSNLDGSRPRKITQGRGDRAWPAWSPDGSRIAFVRFRSGLFTMATDGTDVQKIGNVAATSVIAWNPLR